MRKKIIQGIILALLTTACGKFTDVDPKGQNLLGKVSDLDQLLNFQFAGGNAELEMNNATVLINDLYIRGRNVPNFVNDTVKTLIPVLLKWDETGDRAKLTLSDVQYEYFYSIIGKVANPVLLMADAASGDRATATRFKAEAYVLRAYFHYLAVNFFAKAYNPATAATDGGVPYVKEHDLLSVPNHKYTVQEVYDFILEDLQAAHDLNVLPDRPVNPMRVGKAFAHAVEAKARMSMHDFPGAEAAANAALTIRNTVEDHHDNLVAGTFTRLEMESPEDYFYGGSVQLALTALTPELSATFEPGSIFYNKIAKVNAYGPAFYGLPIDVLLANTAFLNPGGLSTVDMYLILAECKIRSNDVSGAMTVLNDLRAKRVDPYAPLAAANVTEAFAILKRVSRAEGWFGPRNFINLKRWNTEDDYKATIRKTLLGVDYELRPDSPLWIFPFPANATAYNPNLTQNY